MIENPPKDEFGPEIIALLTEYKYKPYFDKIEKEYYYWDKVKYNTPVGVRPELFWSAVKLTRTSNIISFGNHSFSYKVNDYMMRMLHDFDMNCGGVLSSADLVSDKNQKYYLVSSIMEEAIASSQMEGASTTRKVAKEMLRNQKKPKDNSQQMILNNYNTIRFLSDMKNQNLSKELLLEIHKRISEKTLDNSNDEGKFRDTNDIVVANSVTGEVAYTPPDFSEIDLVVRDLCNFANNDDGVFIHPIIKAIIIHFVISFLHPFVDGNGRTARSLFYWYMLKKGYWLTEFLSISRIIYKTKSTYEKVFLYTEHDNFDLGYFINYNLNVLEKAFEELKKYLDKKAREQNKLLELRNISGLNERQAKIIQLEIKNPGNIYTVKDLLITLGASTKTVRADLDGLVDLGYFVKRQINKRLKGYARSDKFEKLVKSR